MKIIHKERHSNRPATEAHLDEYVAYKLLHVMGGGQVEDISDRVNNVAKSIGALVNLLAERGQLSASDINTIVDGYDSKEVQPSKGRYSKGDLKPDDNDEDEE